MHLGAPFRHVEEDNLAKAFKLVDETIQLPTRKRISDIILNRVYDRYTGYINDILNEQYVCIGSDGWTNRNHLPVVNYITINKLIA